MLLFAKKYKKQITNLTFMRNKIANHVKTLREPLRESVFAYGSRYKINESVASYPFLTPKCSIFSLYVFPRL